MKKLKSIRINLKSCVVFVLKLGHKAADCWENEKNKNNGSANNHNENNNNSNAKMNCYFCGSDNQIIEKCFKEQAQDAKKSA